MVRALPVTGIVGLGIMGASYAGHLLEAGFDVRGYDVSAEAMAAFAKLGGTACEDPATLVRSCDVIVTSLPHPDAFRMVFAADGAIATGARAGTIVIETSTLDIGLKQGAHDLLVTRGVTMLDCPVSGTGAQARIRDLIVYASGDTMTIERARPVLDAFARETMVAGSFGAGMKLKYVANLLVSIHNLASAEAMCLAQKAGLDLAMVYRAVTGGAANSRIFELRAPMMVEGVYEPPTMKAGVYIKDVMQILDFARGCECPVPLMSATLPFYTAMLAQDLKDQDTAALFRVLQDLSGMQSAPPAGKDAT